MIKYIINMFTYKIYKCTVYVKKTKCSYTKKLYTLHQIDKGIFIP